MMRPLSESGTLGPGSWALRRGSWALGPGPYSGSVLAADWFRQFLFDLRSVRVASIQACQGRRGTQNVIIAITIPFIPQCARVVRSNALAIREIPYVDAARALGFSDHTNPSEQKKTRFSNADFRTDKKNDFQLR